MVKGNLYNIIDAGCHTFDIEEFFNLKDAYRSLYKGNSERTLKTVAPYLFSPSDIEEHMNLYNKLCWGNSAGIFLFSDLPEDKLHRHLRKFLIISTFDNRKLYFRFYDPRIFRTVIPILTPKQLKVFFGPIDYYICEDENPEKALVFSLENNKLTTKSITKEEVQHFYPEVKKKKFNFL